jgi:hypothetical protein
MKLVLAMISLVAALALVSTAEATPNQTTSINVTLVGNGCGVTGLECGVGGGGSCLCLLAFWSFAGRTNISPPLGSLAFTGRYSDGYVCPDIGSDFTCLAPLTYLRSLTLTFASPNGDELVLGEDFSSTTKPLLLSQGDNPLSGAWTVDPARSTGRFTRYTGSGTYTLSYESHYTYATFTIALVGSLTLH